MVITNMQKLAAIIRGAILTQKLIFFSAHPVSRNTSLDSPSTNLATALELSRLRPRHPSRPHPPTDAYSRAKAIGHTCPLPLPRLRHLGTDRGPRHYRNEQSWPRARALQIPARNSWTCLLCPGIHPVHRGVHTVLHSESVRRRGQCKEHLQVPQGWRLRDRDTRACDHLRGVVDDV